MAEGRLYVIDITDIMGKDLPVRAAAVALAPTSVSSVRHMGGFVYSRTADRLLEVRVDRSDPKFCLSLPMLQ